MLLPWIQSNASYSRTSDQGTPVGDYIKFLYCMSFVERLSSPQRSVSQSTETIIVKVMSVYKYSSGDPCMWSVSLDCVFISAGPLLEVSSYYNYYCH